MRFGWSGLVKELASSHSNQLPIFPNRCLKNWRSALPLLCPFLGKRTYMAVRALPLGPPPSRQRGGPFLAPWFKFHHFDQRLKINSRLIKKRFKWFWQGMGAKGNHKIYAGFQEFEDGARWRFRTSDPHRVKVMLYHWAKCLSACSAPVWKANL